MDWSKIEELIEKYYEEETSLAEEERIRLALAREDCPAHLKLEAELMNFFTHEQQIEWNATPSYTLQPKRKRQTLLRPLSYLSGVAAAIALLAVVYLFRQEEQCGNQPVLARVNNQSICDPVLAEQQAREALQLVASKLNQGTAHLGYIESLQPAKQINK